MKMKRLRKRSIPTQRSRQVEKGTSTNEGKAGQFGSGDLQDRLMTKAEVLDAFRRKKS